MESVLAGRDAGDVLSWAWERFGERGALSSSFQTQSVPLLHMVARHAPGLQILFVDTGYHFPETLEFRDRLAEDWGLNLRILYGDKATELAETETHPLHEADPDRCCYLNKVLPMQGALQGIDALISGVRRDQTPERRGFRVVEEVAGGRIRVHPMLEWTSHQVEQYILEHNLPVHPLEEKGYSSVGCAPCTDPAADRSGRWAGRQKTECGLHTHLRSQ